MIKNTNLGNGKVKQKLKCILQYRIGGAGRRRLAVQHRYYPPHLFGFVLRLSTLIILYFRTLNENILLSNRDFSIQYQFSCTHHPLYLMLLIHSSQLPSSLSFFFFSSPPSPPFSAHSITSSLHWARCKPTPPLPSSLRRASRGPVPPLLSYRCCRRLRPLPLPRRASSGGAPTMCSGATTSLVLARPSSTRRPLSTSWTKLVPSLLVL
jgi:hypothetical protein